MGSVTSVGPGPALVGHVSPRPMPGLVAVVASGYSGVITGLGVAPDQVSRPVSPLARRPMATGYIWLWRGEHDPALGFPATSREVRRFAPFARSIRPSPPPPPLTLSFAEVTAMTDRRAEKCPMDPQILEAKRRRKKELHEQAKRDLRARAAGGQQC
ncbi:hypothetical protein ZWY2020_051238 [Hordeum vulgare]|nr:hypothetical protein ZWY2020_051238 [Hordeum vulgare]